MCNIIRHAISICLMNDFEHIISVKHSDKCFTCIISFKS